MKEKKSGLLLDVIILSVIALVANILPFANYTYKKIAYTMSGIDFITGKTVCKGKIVVEPKLLLALAAAALVIILLLAVFSFKMPRKVCAGGICVLSILVLIGNIQLATSVGTLLKKAKSVSIAYGSVIVVIVAVVLLIRSLMILRKEKAISSLDFMIIPGMLYFIINNYIPMFGISIAFKKVDYSVGIWDSPWVGLDNFKMLFQSSGTFFDSDAWLITRNTLLYNVAFIVLGIFMGIVVGICLADIASKTMQKFFQTSILLPQLISMVIVGYIVYALLSNETGMFNQLLGENAINFYAEKKYWPFILIFVYVWKQVGYNAIIFLASIVGIDKSVYEAARVDGATKWQTIKNITLPMLKPTIITLTLLQVGRIFYSDFGLFYQVPMNSGALYAVTNTIDTYVYRCLMVLNNISTASAASTYQAIVGFVLVLSVNLIVRKIDKDSALF